jgi:hypothetical protein
MESSGIWALQLCAMAGTKTMLQRLEFLVRIYRGGPIMADVERYRRYAAECLRIAQQAMDENQKALLLQMAEHWRRLAEKAERNRENDPGNGD